MMHVYRHKKTGASYLDIGRALVQNSRKEPLPDGTVVVVYQSDEGKLFIREVSEFFDGRFEQVT